MAHRFDPREKHKLESEERRKHLPPEAVLDLLELSLGETLVDLGCGPGYFALPAAERVGPQGQVFAVDVEEEMLRALEEKLPSRGVSNVKTVRSETYRVPLPDGVAEALLLAFVLHEVESPKRLAAEASRLLRPGGRVLVLEWQRKETPMGPPLSERLTEEEVLEILKDSGLKIRDSGPFREWFFFVRAQKA
ncbi:methyltransferase domain-containing protein [Thermosulfurimonas marina]|uniref:Methyltransferase domain-containing protein n=1 Tax=Thermosulfurimonas marina TaxID=2047767 RepID=A0A6H1WTJ3_9BACT|nr:methyltransferase domain-containing protein [Thermosulfurimonas marina]QJA06500.1 methyltransferase domain-containing protein [Thermosulfurimonas marina]